MNEEIDLSKVFDSFMQTLLNHRYRILKLGRYVVTIHGMTIFTTMSVLCLLGGTILAGWASASQPLDETTLTREDVVILETKLAGLEAQLSAIRTTGQTDKLDDLEAELREIRSAISGDPETVLTLQRMNFEMSRLEFRMDTLDAQTKWIFGMTLVLAMGVVAAVLRISFGSTSVAKDTDS